MKQQITKNVIETAFLKLLKERYFEKVMVKDIVEECGLTRNTFYYYYEDTYNIIADILEREIRRIIEELDNGTTLSDAAADIFEFLEENPKIAKHLFTSVKKDEIYGYVRSSVEIVLRYWLDMQLKDTPIAENNKRIIVNTYKYVIQGIIAEWVNRGMKYSLKAELNQTRSLFGGSLEEAILRMGSE